MVNGFKAISDSNCVYELIDVNSMKLTKHTWIKVHCLADKDWPTKRITEASSLPHSQNFKNYFFVLVTTEERENHIKP